LQVNNSFPAGMCSWRGIEVLFNKQTLLKCKFASISYT
jgi:hypothetical protein